MPLLEFESVFVFYLFQILFFVQIGIDVGETSSRQTRPLDLFDPSKKTQLDAQENIEVIKKL